MEYVMEYKPELNALTRWPDRADALTRTGNIGEACRIRYGAAALEQLLIEFRDQAPETALVNAMLDKLAFPRGH
jgi:hypothetical protein